MVGERRVAVVTGVGRREGIGFGQGRQGAALVARKAATDLPRVEVRSRDEWRRWLSANHDRPKGIWLVTYKKRAAPLWFLSYDEIVEEALCFGWIDSLPRTVDARRSMRLVAPRRPKSAWSAVNKARVERLLADGKMAPAGVAAVERAKRDGSWTKLDRVENLVVPPDLLRALGERPGASAYFEAFPRSSRRIILEWIASAKGAETRARRVDETAALAAKNLRAHHWRRRP